MIDAATVAAWQRLGQRQSTSLFMLLTTLLKVHMRRVVGDEEIILGTVSAGRHHPELENQVGLYVNTLALRDAIAADDSFLQALSKVRQTVQDAYAHDLYPFDSVVKDLNLQRQESRNPLFDLMIVMEVPDTEAFKLPGAKVARFEWPFNTSKFDMLLSCGQFRDGRLEIVVEYNTDVYNEDRIERILWHFRELVKGAARAPATPINRLPFLTEEELDKLIWQFNDTKREFPPDRCVVDLFEEHVRATPDKTAVVFGDRKLSYRQLEERANRLAHFLQERGITRDVPVAVYMDRSLDLRRGHARHSQGGRGLLADLLRVSGETHRLHARRRETARAAEPGADGRSAAGNPRADRLPRP